MGDTNERIAQLLDAVNAPPPESVRDRARALADRCLAQGELPLQPGDSAGPYEVIRVLGAGGQAVVFEARHRQIGRRVALKVPRKEVAQRLLREAKLAAALDHPSIARVEDVCLDGAAPYMVLELCENGSLETLLEGSGGLPLARVRAIGAAVLRALAFAHGRGVVHRDVKPANVLFDREDRAKVADFGIGTSAFLAELDHTLSQGTRAAGTPLYMAPEQEDPAKRIDGKLDGRADLFAFGKLVFEMLTGASPRTVRPPSRLRAGLDPAWDDFVFRLTEENPRARFASADEALRALEALPAGAPAPIAATNEELDGEWDGGDWGQVAFDGLAGTYSRTWGTGVAKIALEKKGDRVFEGTWGESERRRGTLRLTLSADGQSIGGTWRADDRIAIRPGEQGQLFWRRGAFAAPSTERPPREASRALEPVVDRSGPARFRAKIVAWLLAVILVIGGYLTFAAGTIHGTKVEAEHATFEGIALWIAALATAALGVRAQRAARPRSWAVFFGGLGVGAFLSASVLARLLWCESSTSSWEWRSQKDLEILLYFAIPVAAAGAAIAFGCWRVLAAPSPGDPLWPEDVAPLDRQVLLRRRERGGLPWWRRALRFLWALILGAVSVASAYGLFILIVIVVIVVVIVSLCAIPITLLGGHVDVHPDPGASVAFSFLGAGLIFATVVFAVLAIKQLVKVFARK